MSEVTTTQKRSAFEYDNVYFGYYSGKIFSSSYPYHLVIKYQNDYYAVNSFYGEYTDTGIILGDGGTSIKYESDIMKWGCIEEDGYITYNYLPDSAFENGELAFSKVTILSQDLDSSKSSYYTTEQFISGNVYAPTGNLFDGIYSYNVLSEVLNLLPVVLVCLIGFIGIRKGIRFIFGFLKGS